MKIKNLQIKRVLNAALFVLFMVAGMMTVMAQQPNQTKLTEYNFHNLGTIEERVFLLHAIQESEFYSYALSNEEGKIDIFVSDTYQCQDSNANSDYDFFLENVYDEWNAYSNLDKTERGNLFVEWRYQLEDEVFLAINEDFNRQLRDGNTTCDGAVEFSSEEGVYQFPASVNAGNLGSSTPPYYCSGFVRPNGSSSNCLSTTPNPAFYYMQIAEPGNLNIYMYSIPSHDIDFDCWGPFDYIETACSQLSCSNLVDCSYSANATENCYINNAQTGQYYILLITNYSNQSSTVYFQNIGTGGTGCSGQKTVTAVANFAERGTITGAGEYECGSSCTLTAIPNEGYMFMNWTDEGGTVISTDTEYTFNVWGNRNVTANFIEGSNVCYLTFNLNDSNGDGWSGNSLVLNFEDGSSQKLTIPSGLSTSSYSLPVVDGSHISLGWISGSYSDQCSFTLSYSNGNVIYYGSDLNNSFNYGFDVDCIGMPGNILLFNVTTESNPFQSGTITGGGQYGFNEICTLTAMANNGSYEFVNWTEDGVIVSTSPTYSFIVSHNRNLVANFNQYMNHWTAESYQNNMFMIGVVQIDGIEQMSSILELGAFCNGECRGSEFPVYDEGRWLYFMTIGGNSGDSITFRVYDHALQQETNLYCFNMIPFESDGMIGLDEPYEVQFASWHTVSVTINPENAGTVSGAGSYYYGTNVILTASPYENSTFINWTIDDEQVSTDTVYSFTMTQDVTLVANFLPSYEVTVLVNPAESGVITGEGIYDYGTNCTLNATANEGYVFANWTVDGEIVSTDTSYTFMVTGPVILTANFDVLYSVSASINPENAGTVTGTGEYFIGTYVTLTAIANEGYLFNSWTLDGEIISTWPSYSFTVTGTMNFIANFDVLYSVSANVSPENAGTVTGIGEYLIGTNVTLTAVANEGYIFKSWTLNNEIVSTEPSYTLTVSESVNLTANFDFVHTQQLATGWSWWSTYIEQDGIDGLAMLENSLSESGNVIKSQNSFVQNNGEQWTGLLQAIENEQGYKIHVAEGCNSYLAGTIALPENHPITLHPGWNWIGYPVTIQQAVSSALANFQAENNDVIKGQSGFAMYRINRWLPPTFVLNPGESYLYYSNASDDVSLVYANSRESGMVEAEECYWKNDVHAYPDNLTLMATVTIDGEEQRGEDIELGAFVNGECRGSASLYYVEPIDRYIAFLTVTGQDDEEVEFKLTNPVRDVIFTSNDHITFRNNAIVGHLDQPFTIHFGAMNGLSEMNANMYIYPNPIDRNAPFTLAVPEDESVVDILITNTLGEVVRHDRGSLSATMTSGLPVAGVYLVKVRCKSGNVYQGRMVVK